MHNLISRNQLDEWRHFEDTVDSIDSERENDYYECLIDCVGTQSSCKRICKEILM